MLNNKLKSKGGFTLIELMVAISIFAIVATIAIGALLSANRVNQKAQAIKLALDNLNFALDSMFYKMEKGGAYTCGPFGTIPVGGNSPVEGCNQISFISPKALASAGANTYYYGWNQTDHSMEFSDGVGNPVSITMPALEINLLQFDIHGYDPNQPAPAWVRIQVAGKVTVGHEYSDFALETVVSEHQL